MADETKNSLASPVAHLEQNLGHAYLGEKATPRFNSQVHIHVHSIRRRLADCDGLSAKAAIDGLIKAGILRADTAQAIKEITYSQEKTTGAERTEITIKEI